MSPLSPSDADGPRLGSYVKHAFLYRWNLLLFLGGLAFSAMSGYGDALIPILSGLELAYLTGLSSIPRFRIAVDAQIAANRRRQALGPRGDDDSQMSLQKLIETLPPAALRRFLALRNRCFEMRTIASGVRGNMGSRQDSAEDIRTPALDKLLFLFLKLLVTQYGLTRFLDSTSEKELDARVEDVKMRLATAQKDNDERVANSLKDNLADAQLRLENYRKSTKDAEFVSVELERIETKIQALIEMGVSRQDPEYLSSQVSAAAESMQHTEDTVNQLQHLSGLADQLDEPPAILEADIGHMVSRGQR
jgi:hypothetical protein